jgi:hypothetical protein
MSDGKIPTPEVVEIDEELKDEQDEGRWHHCSRSPKRSDHMTRGISCALYHTAIEIESEYGAAELKIGAIRMSRMSGQDFASS